jgi:hypothetical protein
VKLFLALAVGYVIGAQAGRKELDELARSWKALRESDEVADVVSAARSHLGQTLHELAAMVDREPADGDAADLVERVRHLVGRE